MKFNTIIDDQSVEMEFSYSLNLLLIKSKKEMQIDLVQLGVDSYSLLLNGKSHYLTINKQPERTKINLIIGLFPEEWTNCNEIQYNY
jgi:hypothetical protein